MLTGFKNLVESADIFKFLDLFYHFSKFIANLPCFLIEYSCITLHTTERPSFWADDFEGVTNAELVVLLQKSCDTLTSVETEFEKQQLSKASNQFSGIDGYSNSLHKNVNKINVLECLNNKAAEHIKAAVEILKTPQTVCFFKVYKEFLHDVLHHCGLKLMLLCAACLSKLKIVSLKIEGRISLLNHVKMKKLSYISSILRWFVTEYDIHSLHEKEKKRCGHVESTVLTTVDITNKQAPAWTTKEGDYTDDLNQNDGANYSSPALKRLKLMKIQGHIGNLAHPSLTIGQNKTAGIKTQMSSVQMMRHK